MTEEKFTKEQLIEQMPEGYEEEEWLEAAKSKGMLAEEEPQTQEEPQQEEPAPAEGDGDVPPKEDEVKPPVEEEKPKEQVVPLAALHEERRKRQERDKELEEMKARLAQIEQQTAPKPEDKDPLEVLVEEKLQAKLQPFEEQRQRESQAQAFQVHVDQMEQAAMQAHPDYEDITKPVYEVAKARAMQGDTSTLQMIFASPNPAEMAYHIGRSFKYEQEQKKLAQQAAEKQAEKVKNINSQPRGPALRGGTGAAVETLITRENLSQQPPEVQEAIARGKIPAGYRIE